MTRVNILVVGPQLKGKTDGDGGQWNALTFPPRIILENGAAQAAIAERDVIVLPVNLAMSAESLRVLEKIRQIDDSVPVVCVAPRQPEGEIATRIAESNAELVTGEYHLTKFMPHDSTRGIAHLLHQMRFPLRRNAGAAEYPQVTVAAQRSFREAKIEMLESAKIAPAQLRLLSLFAPGELFGLDYIHAEYLKLSKRNPPSKIVDVQICKLNCALRNAGAPMIENLRNLGYRWEARLQIDFAEAAQAAARKTAAQLPVPQRGGFGFKELVNGLKHGEGA